MDTYASTSINSFLPLFPHTPKLATLPLMADTQYFNANPLFRDLSQQDLAALSALAIVRSVGTGQALFKPGEARKTFFVVLSGQVHIYSFFNDEVQTLALLQPNEFAVESALVDPTFKHEHYGEMYAAGELLEIDGREFARFREANPAIANRIYGQIILNLTERLHHANNKLVTIYSTGKIAATYDNLDNLSDLVLTTILKIIRAKRAIFVLFKPLEGKAAIREAKGYGNDQKIINLEITLASDPILGTIYSTGQALNVTEQEYEANAAFHTPYASKTMLGTPLAIRNRVIGAILLGDKEGKEGFSTNNLILLDIIARQIVLLVGTAEMQETTSQP